MEQAEYAVMAAVERDHWWYRGMRAAARAWLRPHAAPGWRMLDVGCGTGGSLAFLLNRPGIGFGLDLAPAAVAHAWQHAPGRVVRGSALELPYRSGAFDLVTAFEVLYHQAVPDEGAALAEMVRVLRPGGWALIRMPAYNWLRSAHDAAVHTRRRYVVTEVAQLLHAAGLTIERLSYTNALLLPLVVGSRLVEKLRPAHPAGASALAPPHPLVNAAFELILQVEARWLALGGRLPAGLSILALARK